MDIVKQVADEVERRSIERERLSDHLYGLSHPLVGKPCLYNRGRGDLFPAVPYGAYILGEDAVDHVGRERVGKPILAIAYFDDSSPFEGSKVHVKALSGVDPDDLFPVDPSSRLGLQISHRVLSWLVDNRDGTFRSEQRRRERELSTT